MNRDQILEIADGMSNTTIIMPKNEDLIAFAETIIQHYKDSMLKEVGEPVGYLRTTEKALVFMPLTHVKDGEYFFTESQLLAALAKKEEEIEQLKDEQFKRLEREAEKRMKLREQLATAEQRVAEACACTCENARVRVEIDSAMHAADAIRSGEWRKFLKEGE